MKLGKNSIHYLANLLHSRIDLSGYGEGATLKNIIEADMNTPMSLSVVEKWLRGTPAACVIPYEDSEIRGLLDCSSRGHWSIDNYWRWAADRIHAFARAPHAYA